MSRTVVETTTLIKKRTRIMRGKAKVRGKTYWYGQLTVRMPRELVGREAEVLILVK